MSSKPPCIPPFNDKGEIQIKIPIEVPELPIGTISPFFNWGARRVEYRINSDRGYISCEGQTLSRTEYPGLFDALNEVSKPKEPEPTEFCFFCKAPVENDYICYVCAKEPAPKIIKLDLKDEYFTIPDYT